MKKRSFFLAALLLLFAIPAGSVLKEKDLARTLGVLKAELQTNYEMQQAFMQSYEQQGMQQHKQFYRVARKTLQQSCRPGIGAFR